METVRRIGGWLPARGGNELDTRISCTKARTVITKMAKAWAIGSYRGRGTNSRMLISVRLQVAKAVVIPILTTFSRTRCWTKGDIASVQRVANYAVRRCMGMDNVNMRRLHISDKMLYQATNWDTKEDVLCRRTLQWLGHVAQMPLCRRPKQIMFEWIIPTQAIIERDYGTVE